jgi:hypothetical protein
VPVDSFDELQQPEEARMSHRRGSAVAAMRSYYDARVEVGFGEHLLELEPNRDEGPVHLEMWRPTAEKRLARAVALRDLAKMSDADFPWRAWLEGDPAGAQEAPFRVLLGGAEETLVQRRDEADNAAAYAVDPAAAAYNVSAAEARVLGLRDVISEVTGKADAVIPAPRRGRPAGSGAPTA